MSKGQLSFKAILRKNLQTNTRVFMNRKKPKKKLSAIRSEEI